MGKVLLKVSKENFKKSVKLFMQKESFTHIFINVQGKDDFTLSKFFSHRGCLQLITLDNSMTCTMCSIRLGGCVC